MKEKVLKASNILVSIKSCTIITICMVAAVIITCVSGKDVVNSLVWVRVLFCLINFIIASAVMLTGKKPLFLLCVYMGIMCYFLHQFWTTCNYIWIGEDNGTYVISALSSVSFYLFLFTASYGALDSLVDDGTKSFRKYRTKARIVAVIFTVLWLLSLDVQYFYSTIIVGSALTILTYIVIKHIVIPDVENGFVITLRKYYVVILFIIIVRLAEIFLADLDVTGIAISILRFVETALIIWVFPLAYRGANKWISM